MFCSVDFNNIMFVLRTNLMLCTKKFRKHEEFFNLNKRSVVLAQVDLSYYCLIINM